MRPNVFHNTAGKLAIFFLMCTLICVLCLSFSVTMTAATFETDDNVFVVAENTSGSRWSQLFQANIFTTGQIAPGSKGDYSFSMQNNGNFVIDAEFSITDENLANIPMKFRVRDEAGVFICGDDVTWVELSDLQNVKVRLQPGVDTDLLLEWYWVGDDDVRDTESGIIAQNDAVYVLNLQVQADQVGNVVNDGSHADVPTGNMSTRYILIAMAVTTVLAIMFICIDMFVYRRDIGKAGVSTNE